MALVRTHAVKCLFVFGLLPVLLHLFERKLVERMSFGGSLFLHVIEAADELLVRTFQRRFGVDAVEPRRIDQREEQVAEFASELDTDDAVAIIEDMEEADQQAVLEAMEDFLL